MPKVSIWFQSNWTLRQQALPNYNRFDFFATTVGFSHNWAATKSVGEMDYGAPQKRANAREKTKIETN